MVSVVHSVANQNDLEQSLIALTDGLNHDEAQALLAAADLAQKVYGDHLLSDGEGAWRHALGMALILSGLKLDTDSRQAALLFAVPLFDERQGQALIESQAGPAVNRLVSGISRLNRLRPITSNLVNSKSRSSLQDSYAQIEVLRKMFLAVVEDIRVVLIRLASRTQTLRFYAENMENLNLSVARETLEIYSPLANRLGVWELKWELEDLSFRFLNPDIYRQIAKKLDEKRWEREQFIAEAIERVKDELAKISVTAEIYGRPKHIYSIWNKMQKKGVDFSQVYDIRAIRIIVDEVKDCYSTLGIVHNLWTPIPKEFDDYICKPKNNNYQSLHTAVDCHDGRALEVQIRTREMHHHAELGVAAHWRYKEGANKRTAEENYNDKIAWLRQLLHWKDDISDSSDWVKHYKEAALDETIYVMTPQGKVIDLPRGATPVDFAYWIHTDLGHRCRGAKIDGALAPLNTLLKTGQRIEILSAKEGGPSRDWLNASQGYLGTSRARSKVRHWFSSLALEEALAEGKTIVTKELQRIGATNVSLEDIARRMNFTKVNDLLIAAARNELNLRLFQSTARGDTGADTEKRDSPLTKPPKTSGGQDILIVGIGKLLTQMARCCKPAPPDAIRGFVTRGKGVSIHRADCPDFTNLLQKHPERVIETDWGSAADGGLFAAGVIVDAHDRQGLLRDISDVFAKEKINVTAVRTQSKKGRARMEFTIEINNLSYLQRTLTQIHEVAGVVGARRM